MRYSNHVDKCQIWPNYAGTGFRDSSRDVIAVEYSPRAGGRYQITYEAISLLRYDVPSDKERALLTTILVDQREQGIECPMVTTDLVKKAKTSSPIAVDKRGERLLRFIAEHLSEKISDSVLLLDRTSSIYWGALAWSESTDWSEVAYLCEYLSKKGWIELTRFSDGSLDDNVMLTVDGHSRVADQKTSVDSSQVFVAMWFDESMNEAFEHGIEPAIKDTGFKPLRIDRKEHINKIDDEIIAELRRSRFVVADFTHDKDGARGGVYYEAGFAHGLNLPVIFTCRKDAVETLHFDTEHYNHIVWANPTELREKLKNRVLAVIGEGPDA